MTKTTKILLISSIFCLIAGFALNVGLLNLPGDFGHVVFPVGASLLGLFLISKVLEKETARYDSDHPVPGKPQVIPALTVNRAEARVQTPEEKKEIAGTTG